MAVVAAGPKTERGITDRGPASDSARRFRGSCATSGVRLLVWPIVLSLLLLGTGQGSDLSPPAPAASAEALPPAAQTLKKKLVVGCDAYYPPYEYLDRGQPVGYNVDLIRAVAEVLDLELEIRIGPWRQIRTEWEQGRIEVLVGFNSSKGREKSYDFSVPHVMMSPGLFVRRDSPVRSLEDLRGKEVLVPDGDVMHDFLLEQDFPVRIVPVQDTAAALRLLASGKHDALLASSKFCGLYSISKFGLTNLKAAPTDLPPQRYCFAARKGSQALIYQLNEALAILKATGRYQTIYDQWFGVYEPRHLGATTPMIVVLLLIAAVSAASLLWSWSLRRQVRLRTAELRTSEERFRALVEQAPEAIVLYDSQNGRFAEANQSAERLFGCSRTELLRVGPQHFYTPEQPDGRPVNESVAEHLAQAAAGQKVTCERLIRNAQGQEFYCEARLTQLPSIGLGMTRISYLDITDRKRAEEMTRLEEARLKSILKLSQYPASSYRELLDVALDEIVSLSGSRLGYIFLYSEEKREFTLHAWSKQAMRECAVPNPPTLYRLEETGIWGEPVRQRRPLIINDFHAPNPLKKGHPEGHVAISRFMTVPVFREGQIVAVAGVANKPTDYLDADVRQLTLMMDWFWRLAERRRAEDALRESEERFRSLIEQAPEAILVYDIDQERFVEANQNAERLFGCSREELLRSGPVPFYAAEQPDGRPPAESFREHQQQAIAGADMVFERVIQPPQGENVYCEVRVVHLPCVNGSSYLHRLSYIDITERKRAEAELRRHRDHLEELVHERTAELATANQTLAHRTAQLRALTNQLVEAEQRERRRIAYVLHENFQQLLAAAKFSLQLFRDKGQATAADQAMESLDEAIAVSRSLTVELRPPILYELGLGPALEWLARQKSQKFDLAVQLRVDRQAEPASDGLRIFLFEAARELLLNVAKHAQVKTAELSLSRVGDQIQLQVADHGVGFDPAQPSTSGFGLFGIRERIGLLGGHVEVDSQPGHGTCITLTVPQAEPISRAF